MVLEQSTFELPNYQSQPLTKAMSEELIAADIGLVHTYLRNFITMNQYSNRYFQYSMAGNTQFTNPIYAAIRLHRLNTLKRLQESHNYRKSR